VGMTLGSPGIREEGASVGKSAGLGSSRPISYAFVPRILVFAVTLAGGFLVGHGDAVPRELKLHPCMSADARAGDASSEQKTAERIFVRFLSCVASRRGQDRKSCNTFTAEALRQLYQLNDLYGNDRAFVDTTELAAKITAPTSGWILLGKAESQRALREAKRLVESGNPTVAVLLNSSGEGHVAVVLPGDLQPSPKWNDALTPNSASFPHTSPTQSFIGCKLSYAFPSPKGVSLYYRAKRG
jgi:hypothetical protein